MIDVGMVDRAQGCFLGQLAGDALGSLVEFMDPAEIAELYPNGVRDLKDGGTWGTLAGQPTDDSEMALLLARMLVRNRRYVAAQAFDEYLFWANSVPFDMGNTIRAALGGRTSEVSQANGAMMRVSPVGIFGACREVASVAEMARSDAALTHPNRLCLQANELYAMGIATAIRTPISGEALYDQIQRWARDSGHDPELQRWIEDARFGPPEDFVSQQGWVRIAFGNALYRLLHSSSFEEAVVETVMCGGDTDTNAAITGALLGAMHGSGEVPQRWTECLLNCRPAFNTPGVRRPRPEVFWPVDVLLLAEEVLRAGEG